MAGGSSAVWPSLLGRDAWIERRWERRAGAGRPESVSVGLLHQPGPAQTRAPCSPRSSVSSSRGPLVPLLEDSQMWRSEPRRAVSVMPWGWQRQPFSVCVFSKSSCISAGVTADCSPSDPLALNSKIEKNTMRFVVSSKIL